MTLAVSAPLLTRRCDRHAVADHRRHEAVPHRGDTGQKPAVRLVDAMSLGRGAGAAGWWSWTISQDGVSWSCCNCATIVTPTT
jgi:hypothetical protein